MTDRLRMLMVEDDDVDRMAFERFVEREGLPYDYRVATSAADARAILDADRFDIVLTDYQLGDGTAFDLIDAVRGTPALIITGTGDEKIAVEAMKHGFYDYLVKEPTGSYLSALPVVVKQTLDHWGAKRKLAEYQGRLEEMVAERTRELEETTRELQDEIGRRQQVEEALRESEMKYRILVENAGDAIFVAQEGMLRFYNQKTEELSGRTRQELLSMPFSAFIHPDDQAVVRERHIKRQQGIDLPSNYTFRVIQKSGEVKWVELNVVVAPWEGKTATLNFLRDISDRKRAEVEREKLQDQLSQAQKMESIGRLAGGVAHDFNNMLGVILGRAELALMEITPSDPHYAEFREIQKVAERSVDLTRQLLAFARKQTIAPRVLDLNETVDGMLKMLRRLIGEDIDLAWEPDTNVWPVKMDPAQVDQILANLCVNARDAISGTGKATIRTSNMLLKEADCTKHAGLAPGDYVMLSVSDDGCGMEKGILDKIFEPFFTTKEVGKGTGLGLSTVYGIVRQNEGTVSVESEPGKGTTFKIYIPRHSGEDEAPARTVSDEMPMGNGETVLLVEDDSGILEMCKTMLERLGYRVLAANTPDEAMEMARNHPGDVRLLMTDVVMPRMSGRELAACIVKIRPEIRTLFMSGYTADAIARHGVLNKGVHFIEKPFSIHTLASRVRETIRR